MRYRNLETPLLVPVVRRVSALVVLLLIPLALNPSALGLVTTTVCYAVALLGVNLVGGFLGRVALGHGAFVGAGAYTTVILSADHGWPVLLTVPAGALLGFLLGIAVGLPAVRIRGLHLALVTLAVGASFGPIVKRLDSITNGTNGKGSAAALVAPHWLGEGRLADARWWYLVALAVSSGVFLIGRNLTTGRIGRAIVALRDNEVAARASGVPTRRYCLLMFGCSAAVAATAGTLLMLKNPFASYLSYETSFSLHLFAAATVGGLARVSGAVIGAVLLVGAPALARRAGILIDDDILFGLLLIAAVVFVPDGLAVRAPKRTVPTATPIVERDAA